MAVSSRSILVINAGSSSLKFSVFHLGGKGPLTLAVRGQVDGLGSMPRLVAKDGTGKKLIEKKLAVHEAKDGKDAIRIVRTWMREHFHGENIVAVGHRVVHGGATFSKPVLIDERVIEELEKLIPLAPLHEPHNVAAIKALRHSQKDTPQVACFDTAFHRLHPLLSDLYALPYELYEAGVCRYGLHGLSYEYIASALPTIAPGIANGRVIVAHLGNGASMCAMHQGRSIDSTMGFSALDGIPMGTRPGSVDPGVLLYLLRDRGMSVKDLEQLLYHKSGLLGLSGISNDMRILEASTEARARLAIDYFVHRIAKEIGALTAVLGGLDGLVFTAGIGENSHTIRARVIERCGWLKMKLDTEANNHGGPRITTEDSAVSAWVIPTNEELMIARHTCATCGIDLQANAEERRNIEQEEIQL